MSALRYRRILLKLGGEALAGEGGYGIDPHEADVVAAKVRRLRDLQAAPQSGKQLRIGGWASASGA